MYARQTDRASPEQLAEFFDGEVDCLIPGDMQTVPWIGRKSGRAGVAEFFQQIRDLAVPHAFDVDTILGDAQRCVVLGRLRTEVLATSRTIETEFAFHIQADDDLITRHHMFEDSWAVAQAFRP